MDACCIECGSPLIRDPAAYDRGPHSYCLLCDADVWTWEEMDRAKRRAREWGRAMGMEWASPAAAEETTMGEKYPQMLMQDSDEDYAAWRDPTADDIEAHLMERPDMAWAVLQRLAWRLRADGSQRWLYKRKECEPTTDEALRAAGYVLAKGDHDG